MLNKIKKRYYQIHPNHEHMPESWNVDGDGKVFLTIHETCDLELFLSGHFELIELEWIYSSNRNPMITSIRRNGKIDDE